MLVLSPTSRIFTTTSETGVELHHGLSKTQAATSLRVSADVEITLCGLNLRPRLAGLKVSTPSIMFLVQRSTARSQVCGAGNYAGSLSEGELRVSAALLMHTTSCVDSRAARVHLRGVQLLLAATTAHRKLYASSPARGAPSSTLLHFHSPPTCARRDQHLCFDLRPLKASPRPHLGSASAHPPAIVWPTAAKALEYTAASVKISKYV
ncbi:hypothetical protein C8F04DRAFT_1253424 [Mycena alexandri]|uniref:Uncharacterized protein n=1 Tax=Mycena alexandri TaxID=1745969 RepID=A0AAD6X6K4_9AGAR|nr:hypothetical protein C8F04DRAFT_1253424 [Mycena alexandri]